jgi:hypothetical protein
VIFQAVTQAFKNLSFLPKSVAYEAFKYLGPEKVAYDLNDEHFHIITWAHQIKTCWEDDEDLYFGIWGECLTEFLKNYKCEEKLKLM